MFLPEYDKHDAIGLSELVQKGDVSPQDLLRAAIERIEARNPALNAVVLELFARAKERVDTLPEGPLKGIPFLLKDLKATLAGTPTSNSTLLSKDRKAEVSSVLVKRYEAAGLQIVGKTNTPEFGIMGITEPALRGPCRNPWNIAHTPGGSSGGSASAVAARIVPAAHAGDGGGSIRIPASACGLFGLKPTRGRVSMSPHLGEAWGGYVQEHVVSRSVRDSALLLDIADQRTPGEPYVAPTRTRPWLEEVGQASGTLRIAYRKETLYAGTTHPDCLAAVEDAITLLTDLGHEVVEASPTFPKEEMVRAYFFTIASGVAAVVEETAERAGKKPSPADFEPQTWVLAQVGWSLNAPELVRSQQLIQRAARDVANFFEEYDMLLTSTLAEPPIEVGALALKSSERLQLAFLRALPLRSLFEKALDSLGTNALSRTPNTQLFNQTGQPAMSVPLYWNQKGLPIGVQLAAGFGREDQLFRLASQLEEARPWAQRTGWEVAFAK
ncbi:MAG: amidase [Deltaproteobacteria bacterium]|nr:amidase [Deltaproteobacteria bacterium]